MIATGFETRIKVQEIIDNQLPAFIVSDFPKTSEFLKQYYISQEYQGGSIDIVENLDQYLKLDNLTPDVISENTVLSENISLSDEIITVNNTKGYPPKYGLLKVNDEIITYTGITTNTFVGCVRGFSGITDYDKNGRLIFSTSKSQQHSEGSKIKNLSSLFLKEFYKKLKFLLTPGLENLNFVPELNVNNFIKQAKNFYQSKGTEESFRILFNVLYGVNPKIIDLERFSLKPSYAEFERREIVIAERISGDPNRIVGQILMKNNDENTLASISEVEIIKEGLKEYFKLSLFVGFTDETDIRGNFSITPYTKVIEDADPNSSIITVDSTIGFPKSGSLVSGINTNITYSDKSINQFFGCTGIGSTVYTASSIRTNEIYYAYEDGLPDRKVDLRITGVLSKFIPISDTSLSTEGEKIYVKHIGDLISNSQSSNKTFKQIFANSWIYNTSTRYQIESVSGSNPTFNLVLHSESDKSSLKIGDRVDILSRGSQNVLFESALILDINTSNSKNVTILSPGFSPSLGYFYDIRRKLNKASSTINPNLFGSQFQNNTLVSDVLNVYQENDEYYYVASNSLPSYPLTVSFATTSIPQASELLSTIQGKNLETDNYSIISFAGEVPFLTGDAVYYDPENDTLVGVNTGVYYVEVLDPKNKIKLYTAKSFIPSGECIEFNKPNNDGKHNFTLFSQKDRFIGPQKILKKFPSQNNIEEYGEVSIPTDLPIGMMLNGVEIISYKSSDKVYYGPLKSINILNSGEGYDVVNPPLIHISSSENGENAEVEPVIFGELKEILVDPQDFDIGEILSIDILGGNNSGCLLEPVVETKYREVFFDARDSRFGGGLDITNDTITFETNHNFIDGEPIVYNNNGNVSIGIGPYRGTNFNQNKVLETNGIYYAKVLNSKTVKLHDNYGDYTSGINTVGFTTMFVSGTHKFVTFNGSKILSRVNIFGSDNLFTYKKIFVNQSEVSKEFYSVDAIDHGFSDGEIVEYNYIGEPISGLSTSKKYNVFTINKDRFRLCDAGIGGTITDNYERKNFVKFSNVGFGTHIFKYPNITIDVKVSNPVGVITATPIITGSIKQISFSKKGSGYGSKILNLHKKPTVKIKAGKNAILSPIISGGKVVKINIQNRGSEYYSSPNIIVYGEGVGAKIRPILNDGRIVDAIVIEGGKGYVQETSYIKVVPSGINCLLDPNVRDLTIDNKKRFGNEVLIDKKNYIAYQYVGYSTELGKTQFNDQKYGSSHSPIIGWSYDGCPIYGPYGLSDPQDLNSSIKLLRTSYVLDPSNVEDRPTNFEFGSFIEDYKFSDSGDLDANNGRFCKTLDFPNGVYAYFAGISTSNGSQSLYTSHFPYFIGNKFNYKPISDNLNFKLDQDFDFNESQLVRNTFPHRVNDLYSGSDFINEPNEISAQLSVIESIDRGDIDSCEIVESGKEYSVGDLVIFDNSDSGGGGASAYVSKIEGKEILEVSTKLDSYLNSSIHWKNSKKIIIDTKKIHNFYDMDDCIISGITSESLNQTINGSFKVAVPYAQTRLRRDIPSNPLLLDNNNIDIYVSDIPGNISIGDSIGITRSNGSSEVFSILNLFENERVIRVNRGTVTSIGHTESSLVKLLPNKFEVYLENNINQFDSKINEIFYFNPVESVGIGTTSGFANTKNYTVGDITKEISVPVQSIYLPNHSFETGQKVLLGKPSEGSPLLVSNTESSGTFIIPRSGNTEVLYVIKKSKDYIGLTTSVELITNTSGLYFASDGDYNFEYFIKSQYDQIYCDVDKYTTLINLNENHSLKNEDVIDLKVIGSGIVGIGTSSLVDIKYDSLYKRILINTVGFSSSQVIVSSNSITLPTANTFSTGDKVFYRNIEGPISGISTGDYYIFKNSRNTIQLCETYADSISTPPKIINLTSNGGSSHEIGLINPKLNAIKYKTLKFNLTDPSLIDYKLKIFSNNDFTEEFYSERLDDTFNVSGIGTVGISTNASLLLEYSDHIPQKLYYTLQKDGKSILPDVDVLNYSEIEFGNSLYNGMYSISNVEQKSFNISLNRFPESFYYSNDNSSLLKYTTSSRNDIGGINKITITQRGDRYKKLPSIKSIDSKSFGSNASIISKSSTIGKINFVKILNPGFDYSSDKTLRPKTYISPIIKLTDSDTISLVEILDGGKSYSSPPKLIIFDPENKKIAEVGRLKAKLSSTSIESIDIVESPKGLSPIEHRIISVDNDNGIIINQVESSTSGIITCFLATPILGFSSPPFKKGDSIFVENIEKNDEFGTGFNSVDYNYEFFEVINYFDTNPVQIEYSVSGLTTNPGIAKTFQTNYPSLINYNNYPKFKVYQEKTKFLNEEKLLSFSPSSGSYIERDIFVSESSIDYIKVFGSYELSINELIKGKNSGVIAKINDISNNSGVFEIGYSLAQNNGWKNNTGFISDDLQNLPNNDYYQNLSYTVKSPLEYNTLSNPVNSLLHTSGLKNFADTQIETKLDTAPKNVNLVDSINIIDLSNEHRVDTIFNLDLSLDVYASEERSKYIKLKSKKLTDYIECRSNRVLLMDDVSGLFRNRDNSTETTAPLFEYPTSQKYSKVLVQVKDNASYDLKIFEIIILNNSNDLFLLDKSNLSNLKESLGEIEASLEPDFNSIFVYFKPSDPYTTDYDIKILEDKFNSNLPGIGSTAFGFVSQIGTNSIVGIQTTAKILSKNLNDMKSLFAITQVIDNATQDMNYFETYLTTESTNTYISQICFDTKISEFSQGNYIGTFTSSINDGILNLNFSNNSTNPVTVRSKIIGFGQTSSGIGTYRFLSDGQLDETEQTIRYESTYKIFNGPSDIFSSPKFNTSAIKSYLKVSIGNTSALHQLLTIHDNQDVYTTQYPFLSIGQESGIGTFGGRFDSENLIVSFYPDQEYSSDLINLEIFNEIVYPDLDYLNIPENLQYGTVTEKYSITQYDGILGKRIGRDSFEATWNRTPIFSKRFNPKNTSILNLQTGIFTIPNHFFSNLEEVYYSPGSTLEGVPAISVGIGATADYTGIVTSILPDKLYVNRIDKNRFRLCTRQEFAFAGIYVTFTDSGSGNFHGIEMAKKKEKTIITLNGVIQSPLSKTNLSYNLNGSIGFSTDIICLTGISSIVPTDVLKINEELMSIVNIGLGISSYGPISNTGTFPLASVKRGFFGSISTNHSDGSVVEIFSGSYDILGNRIYFVDEPKGSGIGASINPTNGILYPKSTFDGRVYLRSDYSTNKIYDDISPEFTGIAQTFALKLNGVNTTGIEPGSGILILNGIFQTPTTENNVGNNYVFEEDTVSGVSSVTFTGITSDSGYIITTESDINQNQLPRGGLIVSLGSTPGLGYAPLVGASVTAVINSSGSVISVGLGTTDIIGSGYRGIVSIGITDPNHVGTAASITAIAGAGGTLSFIINDGGSGYTQNARIISPDPSYENLPITGVFRSGIGYTSDTGIGLLVNVDIGPNEYNPVGRFADAARLIQENQTLISEVAVGRMLSNFPGFIIPNGNQNCIDDIKSVLTSIVYNLNYSGNDSVYDAAKIYIDNQYLLGEEEESIYAFEQAKELCIQVMRNDPIDIGSYSLLSQYFDYTIEGDNSGIPGVYVSGDCADVASAITQFVGIVTNAIGISTLPSKTISSASLYEVSSFKISRTGYSFQVGDVFKVVGLVTDKNLSEPISEFQLTVLDVFTDKFASWQFGELDFIDPVKDLQNGTRVRFPLYYNSELLSFEKNLDDQDSSDIDLNAVLLIFINGVIQNPYKNYRFQGGTSVVFTTAPKPEDNISIFFYRGGRDVDSIFINVVETIKDGDTVQIIKNNKFPETITQDTRKVSTIFASDTIETNLYSEQGIDEIRYKPLNWTKQKSDIMLDGSKIYKSRDSIEAMVFPTSKVIKSINPNDTEIFVDDARFFNYEEEESDIVITYFDGLLIKDQNAVSAAATAVVSAAGTIQNIIINNQGNNYIGISTGISIAKPDNLRIVGIHSTYGVGIAASAVANISGGKISSVTIVNPGLGYTFTTPPKVLFPHPEKQIELISDISRVQGFSGIITGITTTTGTNGHPLALKLFTRSQSYQGLLVGYPIYVFDTEIGNGIVSVGSSDSSPIGVGVSFLDNIYEIRSISYNGLFGQFIVNIKSNTNIVGISTFGSASNPVGRFSWGRVFNLDRSSIKKLSIDLKNYQVNSGLSTFPELHRRGFGLRRTGALRKDLG